MANHANNKIRNVFPVDLSKMCIEELGQLYDAALAADIAIQGILNRGSVHVDSKAGDWMHYQAESFTWLCEAIRDEMIKRPLPACEILAGTRQEVVLGYALRCGYTATQLLDEVQRLVHVEQTAA